MKALIALAVITIAVGFAMGDSIDEAEAQKRGVPVAQVQAENALAKEKLRTAALEKQVVVLSKEVSELKTKLAQLTTQPAATGRAVASATTGTGTDFGGQFRLESDNTSLVQFEGKWQVRVTCQSSDAIAIKEILVDGHPADWVTSSMNYGLLNAMGGRGNGRPLNEMTKGNWILVKSQAAFNKIEIVSDNGSYKADIPSSRWRY